MNNSRTVNSVLNIFAGAAGQVISVVLNFAVRTVFLYTLTETYAGINGLFGSIFQILNLANLGIDSAIIFAMYKPLAERDHERVKTLLQFYQKSYRIIGFVILGAGLALLPFLDYLVKGTTELVDLRIVYLLLLLETVSSYWLFAYLASLFNADQRRYEIVRVDNITALISATARIVLLLLLRSAPVFSFYIYCVIGTVSYFARSFILRGRCRKLYPWTREKNVAPMEPEERKGILKNVAGMFTNNVCRVLNDGIDSTIISALLGLVSVGVFSNYLALRSYAHQFLKTVLDPLTVSVGNLCAVESREKQKEFFYTLQFSCFWMYGFCAICLFILSDVFIAGVWLRDTKWLMPRLSVFFLALNMVVEGMAKSVIIYRDANGLFWQTKWRYIFSSVFNAVFSVVLVGPGGLGITGALLGTTVSLLIMVSYDPVLVYREVFREKAGEFYRMYLRDTLVVIATGGIVWLVCLPFSEYTLLCFAVRLGACLVIPNGLWLLLYHKDPRFRYLRDTALRLAGGLKRKLLN